MKTYEIGVLPESEWFFFSPAEDTRQMFYYHTMCGHFYCNRDYYIKRDTYPPLLLVYVKAGTFCLELSGKQYEVNAGQIAFFIRNKGGDQNQSQITEIYVHAVPAVCLLAAVEEGVDPVTL